MQTEKYIHHGKEVVVNSELKGKHRELCLCHSCVRLNTENPNQNCLIASNLYNQCKENNLVTIVSECPSFLSAEELSAKLPSTSLADYVDEIADDIYNRPRKPFGSDGHTPGTGTGEIKLRDREPVADVSEEIRSTLAQPSAVYYAIISHMKPQTADKDVYHPVLTANPLSPSVQEKPQTYEDALSEQLMSIQKMLVRKHVDYGTRNLTRFGMLGILIRMSDKLARLEHLLDKEAMVRDESVDDTLDDLIGYALQAKLLRNGFLGLPCLAEKEKSGK